MPTIIVKNEKEGFYLYKFLLLANMCMYLEVMLYVVAKRLFILNSLH